MLTVGIFAPTQVVGGVIVYTGQERSATVFTSADGTLQTQSASKFGWFAPRLSISTSFTTPSGATGVNSAVAGIDCQLDPNRIRQRGSLGGAGGLSVVAGGGQAVQFGQASFVCNVSFDLTSAALVSVAALPRPVATPGDAFTVKLRKSGNGGGLLLSLDETTPPQNLDIMLNLQAGGYSLEYQVEYTAEDQPATQDLGFALVVRSADINGDGVVNTNDLTRLLARFGQQVSTLDSGAPSDVNGDGVVDTDDLVLLLTKFGGTGA